MEEKGKHMPRRYGMDGAGRAARTWGGKFPEEFGTKEGLLFAADNDLALYGQLTAGTLNAIRESGFRYEAGALLPLQELAEQGEKNKGGYPEVYRLSLGEAKSRGELEKFWMSGQLDSGCRLAMDSAVYRNFQKDSLKTGCLDHIIKEYGFDRVEWILAHTIHHNRDEPHISQNNRDWADTFHVPRQDPVGGSIWLGCVMGCPAKAVELAANLVREEHGREIRIHTQRKPSIKKQLAAGVPMTARASNTIKRVAEQSGR